MGWIYLSPHFDDVALSCGGLVWEQAQSGIPVSIWTVCSGEPPEGGLSPFASELHQRWETGWDAPAQRRLEDLASCQRLGASQRELSIPDCIYRRDPLTHEFMYTSEEALNGELKPGDSELIQTVQEKMKDRVNETDTLVCPLALGKHVDHQLTRLIAEGLAHTLWYYADYPYVLQNTAQLEVLVAEGWVSTLFPITREGLHAWQDSIAAHASQISTFWSSDAAMAQAISDYIHKTGGIHLWRKD